MTEQFKNIYDGMKAGGLAAIHAARLNQTKLVIWRDGKIVEITPDEAEALIAKRKAMQ